METKAKKRIGGVDVARGIAMICIVLGHLGRWEIIRVVFPFHVPIFFLITGWFFRPEKDWKTFLTKKAKALLVPYVTAGILMAVVGTLVHLRLHGQEPLNTFLAWIGAMLYGAGDSTPRLWNVPQIGALWFLLATFWGVVLLRAVRALPRWTRPLAVVALCLAGNLTNSLWMPLSIQAGGTALLFMYIGSAARELREEGIGSGIGKEIKAEIRLAAFVLACFGFYCFSRDYFSFCLVKADLGRGVPDILGSLCACWAVLEVSGALDRYVPFLARPLAVLGKYSLVMLCAHDIELSCIPWWVVLDKLQELGMAESFRFPAEILLKFAWIFLFMLICVKIPFLHPLFGIRKKK